MNIKAYNTAFEELTEKLNRNKNVKGLICTPMGCVRDLILREHFATN